MPHETADTGQDTGLDALSDTGKQLLDPETSDEAIEASLRADAEAAMNRIEETTMSDYQKAMQLQGVQDKLVTDISMIGKPEGTPRPGLSHEERERRVALADSEKTASAEKDAAIAPNRYERFVQWLTRDEGQETSDAGEHFLNWTNIVEDSLGETEDMAQVINKHKL